MTKLIAFMGICTASVFLNVGVMIYGYGVIPHSWYWIIGGGVFANTALRAAVDAVNKEEKRK